MGGLVWCVEEGQDYAWGVCRVCVCERINHTPPYCLSAFGTAHTTATGPGLGLLLCTRRGELAMFIRTLRPRIAFAPAAAAFARSLATARALPFSLSAISCVSRNMTIFVVPGGGCPPYFIFSTVDVI